MSGKQVHVLYDNVNIEYTMCMYTKYAMQSEYTKLTETCSNTDLQRALDICRPSTNTIRPIANASGL